MPDASSTPFPTPPPDAQARLSVSREDNIVRVMFNQARMDGVALRQLYETAAQLTDEGQIRLLLDLSNITYLSSSALGMVVTIKKKLMHVGGQLHVVVPHEPLRQVFETMKLHLIIPLFTDLDQARRSFKK